MASKRRTARDERIARVELEMAAGTFNARALAAELGCTQQTIYNDRDAVLSANAVRETHGVTCHGTREDRREKLLAKIRRTQDAAMEEERPPFAALATLYGLEAKLLGLDDVPPPEPTRPGERLPEDAGSADVETMQRRQLAEVRAMRLDASARGSMVTAAKLLDMEFQLLERLDAARRDALAREAASQDADAVLARFLAAVDRMPRAMAVQLHEALSRALEPAEAK